MPLLSALNLNVLEYRLRADNSGIESAIQLLGTETFPSLSLTVANSSTQRYSWFFNAPEQNITTPSGNTLPEIVGDDTKRQVIQRFRATLTHGQNVTYPVAISNDDVIISVIPNDLGDGQFSTVNKFYSNATSFSVSLNKMNGHGYTGDSSPRTCDVIAIGYM